MQGKIKNVFIIIVMLTLIFGILGQSLGDVQTAAEAVADNTSMPTLIQTIFGYWWVPFLLLVLGLILNTGNVRGRVMRRFRRRRRR